MKKKMYSVIFVFSLILSAFCGCRKVEIKAPRYPVPEWAKQVVWYQIFPERFRNGDPANDPTPEDIKGSWPHDTAIDENWQTHPWGSDWYKLQPWEKKDSRGFYYINQRRRYGGDLRGVLDKLDYLEELGINAIYFNPLFESPSLHKYDARLYRHIDNNFGPNPEKDEETWSKETPDDPDTWQWTTADSLFLTLLDECHKRNIRVIIDGVFNHVGRTFWAFRDVVEKQQNSKYKDWFIIKRWDDPATPENEFDYEGWYGVKDLPEIREDKDGLVGGPKKHVDAIVRRWMDPNGDGDPSDGIDGWRLDVAEMVERNYWRHFRQLVREINPEAYLVGEVWWEDWQNNKMFNAAPWLQGDIFDAVMNYRWAAPTINFFVDKKRKITVSELDKRLAKVRADYPSDAGYVLMNLMGSHDTDRLASNIVNPDFLYDHAVIPKDDARYDVRKPTPEEYRIQKLIVIFQMTYPGAPTFFYGDEAGMWGADDPDERKPMRWDDISFEDETTHPLGKKRPRDKNEFNRELFEHYKKMIRIRKNHPALMIGDFQTMKTDDEKDIYSYQRRHEDDQIVVILNNSDTPREVTHPLDDGEWTNLMTGQHYPVAGGRVVLQINRRWGMVLHRKTKK